ncbi:MAG: cystathionine beta-synthase [Bacteroidia bacterium]
MLAFLKDVLSNMPNDWIKLTTHRLDIYNESNAKTEFLEHFETLFEENNASAKALAALPTAYDYIRLGHPLSCILEWALAKLNGLDVKSAISFQSRNMPILAVLRKNLFLGKSTRIVYGSQFPPFIDDATLKKVYGYDFDIVQIEKIEDVDAFEGSTVLVTQSDDIWSIDLHENIDFLVNVHDHMGSIILANGEKNKEYISEIQHVRRRESVAMTPVKCHLALQQLSGLANAIAGETDNENKKAQVLESIKEITATKSDALLGSSGLSVQYAIMMGLVEDALENHPGKGIKFLVPPNCYGGTNDQARRVAACIKNVEIVDLPVDREHDMAQSLETLLAQMAEQDAIPYIIAEIPTNPRVEVPDLEHLHRVLSQKRKTTNGAMAIDPVFILDQTFCPNVQFLAPEGIFSSIRAICYVSGSKFPSGGKCTAGYCVANAEADALLPKIEKHMNISDNAATTLQVSYLAEQLPSMNQRIAKAYENTREFVTFIQKTLPTAKINFVSEELAQSGFTPSVFSLDLPTKGNNTEEQEAYKRDMNQKLINMMITHIPNESKYCVSYGQLKGCYWTIPATSTQGTTKEADKDYIARVSLSGNIDLEKHKQVFAEFVEEI